VNNANSFPPSFEITKLYEKVSQRGVRYMVGRLGGARVTLLPGEPAEDGSPTWRMLLAEAKPKAEGRAINAPRPAPTRGKRKTDGPAAPLPDDPLSDLWSRGEP
jgi:hypothetical protein